MYAISSSSLRGSLSIPPSKSQTLRAILFAAIARGTSTIFDYLPSPDTACMIEAVKLLGAEVEVGSRSLKIKGVGGNISFAKDVIYAGNSGIVLRFITAMGALCTRPIVITGDRSICYQRPMKALLSGLTQLGTHAISMRGDDFAPIIVWGPMKHHYCEIEGSDSQPVSALLIASAFSGKKVEIRVTNPGEKPWVNLTLHWLLRLGIECLHDQYESYTVDGRKTAIDAFEYHVPGDFSSLAFPMGAALATNSELTLHNVDMSDPQGDKELIHVLRNMGASIDIDETNKTLHIKKGSSLKGIKVDINNFIDALTLLASVACFAEGETHIYNAGVAKQKECNRIRSIVSELKKMGARIQELDDGLIIKRSQLSGAQVDSHHDHRMAMALSVAAFGASGKTYICNTACIAKTYPTFSQDFRAIGANIEEIYSFHFKDWGLGNAKAPVVERS